ncbi:MAG TPA: hypothetical protein VNS08_04840 [Ureibacillus sp.]|nr:hypothetical protein [Ureibacillus sp.]
MGFSILPKIKSNNINKNMVETESKRYEDEMILKRLFDKHPDAVFTLAHIKIK